MPVTKNFMPSNKKDDAKKLRDMFLKTAYLYERINQSKEDPQLISGTQSIASMLVEGDRIIAEEEKAKETTAAEEKKCQPDNPYFQARQQVLKTMSEWHRNELAGMEKTGDIHNRFYEDFVHKIAETGDQLSS
jgi:hypothetical protein